MPFWRTATQPFHALSRRYNLNAPSMEVLTGVIPTTQVDKHWTNDRLDLWGMFMQQPGTAVANRLASCSLVTQEREVLVHKAECYLTVTAGVQTILGNAHLFTPVQGYIPAAVNVAIVFPWLATMVDEFDPGRLSRAVGVVGDTDAGLMVVTVNGAPHTAIGPAYNLWGSLGSFGSSTIAPLWGFQDPPIRVKPFKLFTVQMLDQLPANFALNMNVYFTERPFQGDIG